VRCQYNQVVVTAGSALSGISEADAALLATVKTKSVVPKRTDWPFRSLVGLCTGSLLPAKRVPCDCTQPASETTLVARPSSWTHFCSGAVQVSDSLAAGAVGTCLSRPHHARILGQCLATGKQEGVPTADLSGKCARSSDGPQLRGCEKCLASQGGCLLPLSACIQERHIIGGHHHGGLRVKAQHRR
jgi:hypothetical protein